MPADIIQERVEHGESNEVGLGLGHRVFVENESLEVGSRPGRHGKMRMSS